MEPSFNIQWDDLLNLSETTEVEKSEFFELSGINPSIFDEEFDEESGCQVVKLLTDSQISNSASNIANSILNDGVADTLLSDPLGEPKDELKGFSDNAAQLTREDVNQFNKNQRNKNSQRKFDGDIKRLNQFLRMRNIHCEIQDLPMPELDEILSMFVLAVKKEDGNDYEPGTIRGYMSSFDRLLQQHNYQYTIAKGPRQAFPLLQETLSAKTKNLKKEGKGNKENAAQAIADEEIELLYQTGQLGCSSPQSLLNTLWFYFTLHFGMRGVTEHYNLCWGDVSVKTDAEGTEFLEMKERQTKTRTGSTIDARQVLPRLWSTGDERDPVSAYRFYAAKRPHGFSNPSDPFYLSTRTTPLSNENDQWFLSQRMGLKKIAITMKSMAQKAGIERRLTNHSARKHLVQKLRDSKQAPTGIMQISGHKNVQSIINYSSMSLKSQKECSKILSGCCPAKKRTASATVSAMQPVVSGSTSNMTGPQNLSHSQQVPPVPASRPPPVQAPPLAAPSVHTSSTPGNMQSMFWGATVHIQNMNFYTMPGTNISNNP